MLDDTSEWWMKLINEYNKWWMKLVAYNDYKGIFTQIKIGIT
jgi:hypothetical protein